MILLAIGRFVVTVLPNSHIPYPFINGAEQPCLVKKSDMIFSSFSVTISPPVIGYFKYSIFVFLNFEEFTTPNHILVDISVIAGLYFFIPFTITFLLKTNSGTTVIPICKGIKISSTFPVENHTGTTA